MSAISFDTAGAAAALGLSPATLRKYRVRGGGPAFVRLGSRVVYRRADLEAWVDSHARHSSTSDPGQQEAS